MRLLKVDIPISQGAIAVGTIITEGLHYEYKYKGPLA